MQAHDDPGLEAVARWFRRRVANPDALFAEIVRKSIDEVLDGPRTGRWGFDQLEKTEQTYVGTKLEIVTRTALGLEYAGFMDLEIDGYPVDIKWSKTSAWQIPREAVGQLCLCVGALAKLSRFHVGLLRCEPWYLNLGSNQDGKTTISKAGREAMSWIVEPTPIPPNFVAEMDPAVRTAVMEESTIQRRVTRLFASLPGTAIPRDAVRTVAQTEGDPMRRLRADSYAGDPLGGYKVLSFKYGNKIAVALGYPPLKKDEFMSVPIDELGRLPAAQRAQLGLDI